MLLTESEVHMTELIKQARVPIKKIQMNKSKSQPLQQKLAQQIAQDPALKHMAQKAFVSYMRSLHLQSNKQVFDISKYSPEAVASAWGLETLPRLRFVEASDQKTKNIPYALREEGEGKGDKGAAAWRELEKGTAQKKASSRKDESGSESEEEGNGGATEAEATRVDRAGGERRAIATSQPQSKMSKLFNRKNHDVLSDTYRKMVQVCLFSGCTCSFSCSCSPVVKRARALARI